MKKLPLEKDIHTIGEPYEKHHLYAYFVRTESGFLNNVRQSVFRITDSQFEVGNKYIGKEFKILLYGFRWSELTPRWMNDKNMIITNMYITIDPLTARTECSFDLVEMPYTNPFTKTEQDWIVNLSCH